MLLNLHAGVSHYMHMFHSHTSQFAFLIVHVSLLVVIVQVHQDRLTVYIRSDVDDSVLLIIRNIASLLV